MTQMFGMNAWILLVLVIIAPVILYLIWTSVTHCCSRPPSLSHQLVPDDDGKPGDDQSVSTTAGSMRRERGVLEDSSSRSLRGAFPGSGAFTSRDLEAAKMEENPIKDTRFVGNKQAPSSSNFFTGMFYSS